MNPVVVLACGNPSRGDDAVGPLLIERASQLCAHERLPIDCVEEFQLQIENALDLRDRALCLFVDASIDARAPFTFARIEPGSGAGLLTHALSPAAVLAVFRRVEGVAPPPAFVLAVRGEAFALGAALSDGAARHLEAAWTLLAALLRVPNLTHWNAIAQGAA